MPQTLPQVGDREVKTIIDRVTSYGPVPRTPKDVLIQARALLAEEGKWSQGTWFRDGDPQEAFDKAVCGSWSACAMGAVGMVSGEAKVKVVREVAWIEDDEIEYVYFWHLAHAPDADPDWGFLVESPETAPLSYRCSELLSEAVRVLTNRDEEQGYDPDYDFDTPGFDSIVEFNDAMGRDDVLQAFDKAIESS